jgi:hypothetical protein
MRIFPYVRKATARWVPAFAGTTADVSEPVPSLLAVIPAQAGVHCPSMVRILPYVRKATARWVPAFAGTTNDVSEPVASLLCRHSSASWNPLPVSDAHLSVRQEGNGKVGPSFRWDDGIEACPKSVRPLFCRHSSASWNPLPVSGAHPSVRQEGNGKLGPGFHRDDGRTYPNRCRHHLAVIPAQAGIHCP